MMPIAKESEIFIYSIGETEERHFSMKKNVLFYCLSLSLYHKFNSKSEII